MHTYAHVSICVSSRTKYFDTSGNLLWDAQSREAKYVLTHCRPFRVTLIIFSSYHLLHNHECLFYFNTNITFVCSFMYV